MYEFFERVPNATLSCFRRLLIVGCIGSIIAFSILIRAFYFDTTTTHCTVYDSKLSFSSAVLQELVDFIPFVQYDPSNSSPLTEQCNEILSQFDSSELLPDDALKSIYEIVQSHSQQFNREFQLSHSDDPTGKLTIQSLSPPPTTFQSYPQALSYQKELIFHQLLQFAQRQPVSKRIAISSGLQGYFRYLFSLIRTTFFADDDHTSSDLHNHPPHFSPLRSPSSFQQMQFLSTPTLSQFSPPPLNSNSTDVVPSLLRRFLSPNIISPTLQSTFSTFSATISQSTPSHQPLNNLISSLTSPISTTFTKSTQFLSALISSTPQSVLRLKVTHHSPITFYPVQFDIPADTQDPQITLSDLTLAELLESYPLSSIPPNINVTYFCITDHLTLIFIACRLFIMTVQLLLRFYYLYIIISTLRPVLEQNPPELIQLVGRKLFLGPHFALHLQLGAVGQYIFQYSFTILLFPVHIAQSMQYFETAVRLLTIHYALTTLIAVNESESFMRQYYAIVDRNAYEYSIEARASVLDIDRYCFTPQFGPALVFFSFLLYKHRLSVPLCNAQIKADQSVKLLRVFGVDLEKLLSGANDESFDFHHIDENEQIHQRSNQLDLLALPEGLTELIPPLGQQNSDSELPQSQTTTQQTPQAPAQSLPKSTNAVLDYLFHLKHASCSICLLEFEFADKLMVLPCFHTYHAECAKKWLFTKGACPMCLKPIRKCPPELCSTLSGLVKPQFKQFNGEFDSLFEQFLATHHTHEREKLVEKGASLDAIESDNANNEHEVDLNAVDPHLLHLDSLIKSILNRHTQEHEFSDDFDE